MGLGAGYKARCGVGKETEWGTLVPPAELIPFLRFDPKKVPTKADGESLVGKRFYEDIKDVVMWNTAGSIVVLADFQALDILLGLVFTGTWTKTGSSEPYTHEVLLGETADRSVSLAVDKDVEDDYFEGVKVNDFTWHSTPNEVIATFGSVVEDRTRGTTHHSTLVGLSFTLGRRIFHHQAVFRIADCADALAAGDAIGISEFEFVINNNFKADDFTTVSQRLPAEQKCNAKAPVTIRFTIPRYTAKTWVDALENETKLQADIVYTGPALGGGNYEFKLEFPTLKVVNATYDIDGPALINHVVECECYRNNGNTNMSGISQPAKLTIKNARDTAAWS